jgi:trehalose synthase
MRLIPQTNVHTTLADYAEVANLRYAVESLRDAADQLVPALRGRVVWMVNSTAQGGGVAELLPGQIALLRELGVDVRWAVLESSQPEFFVFTKRLHNLIHGVSDAHPTAEDRALYEAVNDENARFLEGRIRARDIVVVHDPQPAALGSMLKRALGNDVRVAWRSHIGLDHETPDTRVAWEFLRPYVGLYDHAVFSLAEYVPDFLSARATVIHPTIDPLSHKNRDLSLHKMVGIMCDAGLAVAHWPVLDGAFEARARRLQPDGSFGPATAPDDIGLLARPIVTQVSRWDRLKGFAPLLEAFALLKSGGSLGVIRNARHKRRLENARLVLAGPDPSSIQDDPEGLSVLEDLAMRHRRIDPAARNDIALVTLPMASRKQNALMVNVLQRASDIVAQNSLQEGFGLTVAEAMWKHAPILGSGRASGIRLQVRGGMEGCLVEDPEDVHAIATVLFDMLGDEARLEQWGRRAQRRVHDEFLMLGELVRWLRLLTSL